MAIFDSKHFNPEVFLKYLETVPRIKQNAFLKAGILRPRNDLKTALTEQTGGNYITVPMTGLIGGDPLNYDGATDITATGIDTYTHSMIVVGRAKAWKEQDFTKDITGKDFMEEIAKQVGGYWDDVDQTTIVAELNGIFSMSGSDDFVSKHTLETDDSMSETTLNDAIQHAAGANKGIFTLAIMHSQVRTNLENLGLIEYAKGVDANGIQRPLDLPYWNGRAVLVDDDIPVTDASTYEASSDVTVDASKTYYTRSGSAPNYKYTKVASPTGNPSTSSYYEKTADKKQYTTYLLGQGAFDYCDCGAKVPSEVWRDPQKAGGEDWLITRQRKLFAPRGINFVQPSTPIISPTDEQLATGARWSVAKSTENVWYNSKAIPIARILSLG